MRKITDQIGIDRKTTYQMIAKDFIKINLRLVECKRPWISWLSHKDMLTRALLIFRELWARAICNFWIKTSQSSLYSRRDFLLKFVSGYEKRVCLLWLTILKKWWNTNESLQKHFPWNNLYYGLKSQKT